nr:hypothetical protein [uncultured bacterium]
MSLIHYIKTSYINNMPLKIVRYKNYGCVLESEESEDPYDNRFFWSFFELNNGKTIELQLVENLKNNKITGISYEFYYAKQESKTGQIHEFKFGNSKPNSREFSNEFFDWFNNLLPAKDLKDNRKCPSSDEEKYIKDFFDKNILKSRTEATNTINLKT